jgi:hypothetical protein
MKIDEDGRKRIAGRFSMLLDRPGKPVSRRNAPRFNNSKQPLGDPLNTTSLVIALSSV